MNQTLSKNSKAESFQGRALVEALGMTIYFPRLKAPRGVSKVRAFRPRTGGPANKNRRSYREKLFFPSLTKRASVRFKKIVAKFRVGGGSW
jgi:hypothetical protein